MPPRSIASMQRGTELLASSLIGLWVGSYVRPSVSRAWLTLQGPHGMELGHISVRRLGEHISTSADGHFSDPATNWLVEWCKVTGDRDVPSGEVSWLAELASTASEPALPTVLEADLLAWSNAVPGSEVALNARWHQGTVPALGRGASARADPSDLPVALTGFVQPRWISAQAIFVRDPDHHGVDEIRVRWPDLGKVASFRRFHV